MKKNLQLAVAVFLIAIACESKAQLANGSTAPNFTLTDITGASRDLYSYLNAGKTVFIDISATWCSPCWDFHTTHALDDLYNQHGPSGTVSQDIIVLFVEDDPTTTSADLHGDPASISAGNSMGDWVTGSPYPIVDITSADATAFDANYNIQYFPTLYMICPDKKTTELDNSVDVNSALLYGHKSACATSGMNDIVTENSISVYPNPVSDLAILSLNLTQRNEVSITIVNAIGQVVYAENLGTKDSGEQKCAIDISGLNNGIYFLHTKIADQTIIKKISVMGK